MSTTRTVWLVARREIVTRVRNRAFVLGLLAMIGIMAGYAALMVFIGTQAGTTTVGFTERTAALSMQVREVSGNLGAPVETREVSPNSGREQVRDGELAALITGPATEPRMLVNDTPDEQLRTALDTVVQQQAVHNELERAGLDPEEIQRTAAQSAVPVTSLEPADPDQGPRLVMAMAAGGLLYLFLVMSGNMVAQGVVEEKSSRVVELLLSAIRPTHLLAGKVLGIGIATLLQLVVIGGVAMAGALAANVPLPSSALFSTAGWALLWFLLGFFTYATMLAAAASLVSRQEDLQSVVSPVIMLLVVPFVIGIAVLPSDPESTLGMVLSLIPGFSPMLMPIRSALGVAAPWELALAVALSVMAVLLLLWVGGRIYRNAVLRTGSRVKLRDALRAGDARG